MKRRAREQPATVDRHKAIACVFAALSAPIFATDTSYSFRSSSRLLLTLWDGTDPQSGGHAAAPGDCGQVGFRAGSRQ